MPRKRNTDPTKRGKFTEVLEQLVGAMAAIFITEFKDTADVARRRAELAMSAIQGQAAGTGVYIGKGHLWAVTEKHRRIYRRFTGDNHAQLARDFGLTERQIYTAIERVSQEEFERRQAKLPGFEL